MVPLPNEVFGALNKLDSVNWKRIRPHEQGDKFYRASAHRASCSGAVIADGFIAVQAEDAPSVKEIGQRVLSLAKGIGVGNSIVPHAKAITEAADRRNWPAVRQELDRTQNSVQQAMNEVHDEKLSQLVSLGGWLRGTQVLTAVVDRAFFGRMARSYCISRICSTISSASLQTCRNSTFPSSARSKVPLWK